MIISLFFLFTTLLSQSKAQYLNTQNCSANTCQLPDCYCPSFNIPGNLSLNKTPQFILSTLDDSMYVADFIRMSNYSWILNNTAIKDSLGCTIKISWYSLEICKILYIFRLIKKFFRDRL